MNGKPYVVSIHGTVYVDTTVAVVAESEEDAVTKALAGVRTDTYEWLHSGLADDLTVGDVSEESWEELIFADQRHLLTA